MLQRTTNRPTLPATAPARQGAAPRRAVVAVSFIVLGLASSVLAQCPAGWISGIGAPGANNTVRSLAVLPNGDIVAGGSFTLIGNSLPAPNKFARYSVATGTWSAPATGTNGSLVHALAALPDGNLLLGGNFSSIGGVATRQFARYDFSTETFSGLGYGNNGGQVNAILLIGNDNVMIGGNCPRIAGVVANHVGRYNLVTGVWTSVNSQMVSSGDQVLCLALAPDGTVIVGGTFLSGGGVGALRIARYHPTTNSWSTLGSGMNNSVEGVTVLPNGDVIAGGSFTLAGGVAVSKVARYNPTTGVWSDMGGGVTGAFESVSDVQVLPDGNVVVGGSFTNAGGTPASRIARYNTATNTWTAMGSGVNNDVDELAALPTGDVVAGGFFTTAGSTSAARIGWYTFGGTAPAIISQPADTSACIDTAAALAVDALGQPSGGTITYQWQWQPAGPTTAWVNVMNGDNAESGGTPIIHALNAQSPILQATPLDAHIAFAPRSYRCIVTNTCGSTVTDAAVLTPLDDTHPSCCPCSADFDASGGTPDAGDIDVFFAAWLIGEATADTDCSGGTPDAGDIDAFFAQWLAGGC